METIKFKTISKPKLWGSETWLISAVPGSESVAVGGSLDGLTLPQIVERYGADVLGHKVHARFGNEFPLLAKFIHAKQDLSIQVHPDDEMARREHGTMGKNEMWYVIGAEDGACLIDGFRTTLPAEMYDKAVADGSIEEYLNKVEIRTGDVYYIPAGRVHGIGAGSFIAEVQQSSDVTYRLYDYNRRDSDGNLRELHTELARQAADLSQLTQNPRSEYNAKENRDNIVVQTPHFTTSIIPLSQPIEIDFGADDSFHIFITLEGGCSLVGTGDIRVDLGEHEAALIPASTRGVTIMPHAGGTKLMACHI